MMNAETIQRNFNLFITRLTAPSGLEEVVEIDDDPVEVVVEPHIPAQQPAPPPSVTTEPARPQTQEPARNQTPEPERPAAPQTTRPPQTQTPAPQTAPPSAAPSVQTRDRTIYFTQISNDGQILQTRVTRRLPVSQSPMMDSLNALFTGPSAEELNRGIINLIPQNTRVLTATVRGSTAYISFSEDFLFNTFGVEGYVAQLRQIVWTVTEFSTVNDVQILIDGRRLDYLGEGIWIGSPISRQSF